MSDFKFSCPACGQHLSGDASLAGLTINCPACQKPLAVPAAAPTPLPPLPPRPAGLQPPPPLLRSNPPPARQPVASGETCGLAVASLACSSAGIVLGYLGTIPGIICGHKALNRIGQNGALRGRGLATAGLITGYVMSVLWIPLTYILVMGVIGGFRNVARVTEARAEREKIETQFTGEKDSALDIKPDGSGWTLDLENVTIPDAPLAGRIEGQDFTPQKIEVDSDFSGMDFTCTSFITLRSVTNATTTTLSFGFGGTQDPAKLEGTTITVRKDDPDAVGTLARPHLSLMWVQPGAKARHTAGVDIRYAMHLEFGKLEGDKLPGRIYLCILDQQKSFLRGKFVAVVRPDPFARPGAAARAKPPADFVADDPAWTLDLETATIPDAPVSGRVNGRPFKVQRTLLELDGLKFQQGTGFFPDRQMSVTLFLSDPTKLGEQLSGQTLRSPDGNDSAIRTMVAVEWKDAGESLPHHAMTTEYAMRIEFGEYKNGRLPGRIYLCVLDQEGGKSYVRGKFNVTVPRFPDFSTPLPQTRSGAPPPYTPPPMPRPGLRP